MSKMPFIPCLTEGSAPTQPEVEEVTNTRRVPPYNVILHNDDHHSMEFVIQTLCKALGFAPEKSVQLTLEAHNSGRAVVWTGSKEVAELKVDQIRTYHETREADGVKLGPLTCSIEPAPGS